MIRRRIGGAVEQRLLLLSPARRQRFDLVLATVERLAAGRDLRVLDAGCGDGLLTEALARRNPGWRIVGADASATMLDQAGARLTAAGVQNVELVVADLTESIGDSRFDVVAAIECLPEIEDDRRALRLLADALVPDGGHLVVHVPEQDWGPALPGSAPTWRHEVRHGYSRAELVEIIEAAGLTVVEIRGSYRRLVQAAQEIRDRIKDAPIWVRALALPLMVLAVRLESAGLTWGREQALFAVAVRSRGA